MTTTSIERSARRAAGTERAIAQFTFRRLWKQALVVGIVCAAVSASSATSYAATYPTDADRREVAASLGSGGGLAVMFGQVDRIGTVGGYTAYKGFVFLSTIGAIWATFAVTRLLRGEEDRGRWQLLCAAPTNPQRATRAVLASGATAVALVALPIVVTLAALTGRRALDLDVAGAVALAASTVIPVAVFGGVAAVCSQVASSRRVGDGMTFTVIAVAFIARMIGDSGASTAWLLWATPFGWTELVHPYTDDAVLPVLVGAAAALFLSWVAIRLASRRDTGTGIVSDRDIAPARRRGLGSTGGLLWRRLGPTMLVWTAALAGVAFIFGTITKTVQEGMGRNSDAGSALADFGATGSITTQYLGVTFLFIGALVALSPSAMIGSARDDEASGRLALLLAAPVDRRRWWLERHAWAATTTLVIGIICGAASWTGAASQGLHVSIGSMVAAGANTVPAALLALGVGSLTLALAPRAASAATYLLVGWSFVIDLVSSLVGSLRWTGQLSLFHHVALLPADSFSAWPAAVMVAGAVAAMAVSTVVFARRDVIGP